MLLALSVISAQAGDLGPTAYKVFDDRGGSIGRLESNDWTLPDPDKFVSSKHAAVTCAAGEFFLEDVSTNGTFVNQHERAMPKEPVRLQDGDRIFIGDYEILVQLIDDGGAASGLSPILAEDAFAPAPAPVQAAAPAALAAPPPAPVAEDLGSEDLGIVDPLALLGSGSRPQPPAAAAPPPRPAPPASPPRPTPPSPPPPRPAAAAPAPPPAPAFSAPLPEPGEIPDDWERTLFGNDKPGAPASTPAALPSGDGDRTQFRGDRAPPRPIAPAEPAPPRSPAPAAFAPDPLAAIPAAPVQPAPPPRPVAPAASASYAAPAPVAAPMAGAPDLLTALGLDPTRVDPAIQQQLGHILRVVVQGLIEVLHARAEVKNNFRMPMTSIRPVENNPLKFSMNVDDALHNLFVKRNPGYLPPVEAFQESLQDVNFHQMAMLAGIRTAFNAMLAKFHPSHLEEIYERKLKRTSLIPVGGRLKFWDMYRSQFEDIERDTEAHFQLLFGEEFARAYHEQMQKLANAARHQKRGEQR